MSTTNRYRGFIWAGIFSGLLTACGGGGSQTTTAIPPAPPIAGPNNPISGVPVETPTPESAPTPAGAPGVTATSGIPKHILTAEYLLRPFGTTRVTPAQAAPHVTWVQTDPSNGNTMAALGIKVQAYFDPNRIQSDDPLFTLVGNGGFAQTCSGSRISVVFNTVTQFINNPENAGMRSAYAALVADRIRGEHVDAIFEDNAGPLSGDLNEGVSFHPGLPCNYSDTAWTSAEEAVEAQAPIPTIFNGLSSLNGHNVSLSIDLLNNAKTIGGTYESCFSDNAHPEEGSWPWLAMENSQLEVVARNKLFTCLARNLAEASLSARERLYTYASFLLTYDPTHSILWEEFATPSGFRVEPESQLVAMQPEVSAPANVSSLRQSSGVYFRAFRACFIAGNPVGSCAVIVNPDSSSHPLPSVAASFHHTLALQGGGVLDGGTISTKGSAQSSTVGALTGAVLFQ